jgi:hypothetical protein
LAAKASLAVAEAKLTSATAAAVLGEKMPVPLWFGGVLVFWGELGCEGMLLCFFGASAQHSQSRSPFDTQKKQQYRPHSHAQLPKNVPQRAHEVLLFGIFVLRGCDCNPGHERRRQGQLKILHKTEG